MLVAPLTPPSQSTKLASVKLPTFIVWSCELTKGKIQYKLKRSRKVPEKTSVLNKDLSAKANLPFNHLSIKKNIP